MLRICSEVQRFSAELKFIIDFTGFRSLMLKNVLGFWRRFHRFWGGLGFRGYEVRVGGGSVEASLGLGFGGGGWV